MARVAAWQPSHGFDCARLAPLADRQRVARLLVILAADVVGQDLQQADTRRYREMCERRGRGKRQEARSKGQEARGKRQEARGKRQDLSRQICVPSPP